MRGCFLYPKDIYNETDLNGIDLKVKAQIGALNDADLNCELIPYVQSTSLGSKVLASLPLFNDGISWPDAEIFEGMDYLYLRRPRIISRDFLLFLKRVKETNPDILILMEIPTYPYDGEYSGLKMLPALRKDKRNRKNLGKYVDRIVDLSGHDEIFGIPTVAISNGVDLKSIRVRNCDSDGQTINVYCAAAFAPWHGVDRFVEGMGRYKSDGGSRKVILHLVGDGDPAVMTQLHAFTSKHDLDDDVVFYGFCSRKEMDEICGKCSVAVECLGNHRKGMLVSGSLKSREYLAKGLPFIYSGVIDVFQGDPVDFCLEIPFDESPVNIEDMILFHDSLREKESEEHLIRRIRAYAEKHIDMDKAMGNVIAFIRENCGEVHG